MNFDRLLRDFQRLDSGAKFVFLGSILATIFIFLPWFQVDQLRAEEGLRLIRTPEISNGFGVYPVFGFLSLSFVAATLAFFVQYFFGAKKVFGVSHGNLWMITGGQAIFTLFIAVSIFSSEIRSDSTAQMRFGIFAALAAFALIAFGGYLFERSRKEEEAREALSNPFSKELNHLNIRPEEPSVNADQLSLSDTHERKQSILR